MSNEAFVTLATNDTYGLGALVLGRSLRRVATSKQTVVLVTADVSQKMKDELGQVFNLVVTVDTLDSGDAAHLALMSRPELGITFTKLHAWRLVQFSKCVFLDADTLVVQNCDELFEREELSAAPDPGWPDCFNSGVFVFVPSEATFKTLMDFAVTHGSFDGGDQGLLNMFFSDWATGDIRKHLPFIYNVVSSATYSYLPALKHFGSQVKIAHFLGTNKPWMRQGQLGTSSPYQRAWWSIFREDVAGRLSQDMIVARPVTGGSTTPILLPRYRFKDPWDFARYENEGNRPNHQQAGLHQNPDIHSQTSSNRNENSTNQFVKQASPIVFDSFQNKKETLSLTGSNPAPIPLPRSRFKDPWDFVRFEIEGNRQIPHQVGLKHQSTDGHSQSSSTNVEKTINQFVQPIVCDSFQSNEETTSSKPNNMTSPTPKLGNAENLKLQSLNVAEEKYRRVGSNSGSEAKGSYKNDSGCTSDSKPQSFNDNIKDFPTAAVKETSYANNNPKRNDINRIKHIKDLNYKSISANTKSIHEIKVYHKKENNLTSNVEQDSFSKSEAVGINVTESPAINTHTSPAETSKINAKIDNKDCYTKTSPAILRSENISECAPLNDLNVPKSVNKERNAKADSSNKTEKLSLNKENIDKISLNTTEAKIVISENSSSKFESVLNSTAQLFVAKADHDVGRDRRAESVGTGRIGMKAFQSIQTDNTPDKQHSHDKTTIETIPQDPNRPSDDENNKDNNAGVAGVLARGEPDDWRREAWEAGDVDYLGRDSFDNIWKRICECVGITAQTLSAPAAPAATSAGIANQPPAPAPTTEKVEATAPPTEKPSVTIPEKQTEPIISAEKPLSPSALPEKQAEPDVASQKQAEPDTGVQKQAEPIVTSEKPAETAAPVEKPVDTAVVEKPAEPAVPVEKPAEPEAQKQVEPVVSIEKSVESTAPADKPAEPIAPAEKPVEPVTSAEIPAEPIIPAEKPVEPVVTSDKPGEPVISAEKPAEPVLIADKQAEPAVPAEKPVESVTSAEKPTEPAAGAEKSSEPSITSEKLAPVPEKLPETAPAAVEISAVADKDRLVESTPAVEPSESPKAVELEKPAASAPPEEKLTKQEAPAVEKAATAVSEPPTKTTTAEKPEQSAITLPKETDTVPSEKKAEATLKLEKPVETGPTGEKPTEKPAEPSQETVKPAEPLEAAEMCPLKPTKSKPEAPVSISSQPTASESSSKSGEARVQPPLVGDEAPVCKQEPGTPTITPPSGPGSPQPADVPPEVCKLQATASQPATPPASSHQTTDAPVPPKRKQGKNGKSGKGKK